MENEKIVNMMSKEQIHNLLNLSNNYKNKLNKLNDFVNNEMEELLISEINDLIQFNQEGNQEEELFNEISLLNFIKNNDNNENFNNFQIIIEELLNSKNTYILRFFQYQLLLIEKINERINFDEKNDIICNILKENINMEFYKETHKLIDNDCLDYEDLNKTVFGFQFDRDANILFFIKEIDDELPYSEYDDDSDMDEDILNKLEKNEMDENKEEIGIKDLNEQGRMNFLIYYNDPINDNMFIKTIIDSLNIILTPNFSYSSNENENEIKNLLEEIFRENESERGFISLKFLSEDFSHIFMNKIYDKYKRYDVIYENEEKFNKIINTYINVKFENYKIPKSINNLNSDNSKISIMRIIGDINDDFDNIIKNSNALLNEYLDKIVKRKNNNE